MNNELKHFGVKGMKWGVRKSYDNTSRNVYKSSLKSAKSRLYGKYDTLEYKQDRNVRAINEKYGQLGNNGTGKNARMDRATRKAYDKELSDNWDKYVAANEKARAEYKQSKQQAKDTYKNSPEYQARKAKAIKAAKIGAAVAGTALAAYGAYKVSKAIKENKQYKKNVEAGKRAYEHAMNLSEYMRTTPGVTNGRTTSAAGHVYNVTANGIQLVSSPTTNREFIRRK